MKEKSYFFPVVKPRKQIQRKAEKNILDSQNLKNEEENSDSDLSSQTSMQEGSSVNKNFKRKASIANKLKNNRRPTIIIEEGTSLNNEFGDRIIETSLIKEEEENFKVVSKQILIQPSVTELPKSKEFAKLVEKKKWGIKLNLKLLAGIELKVCCLERSKMVEIGEFSFFGLKDETRSFDLIPINQEDTKNFDDLLFVIECHHNDKRTIRKLFIG